MIELPLHLCPAARRPAIFPRNCLHCSIAASPTASPLSAAALRDFHALGICRHREPHTILFHEGLPAHHLLVLCAGRVKITASSSNGRLLLLGVATPGDVLGLVALQENALHRVTVETLCPCTLKFIPRADFISLMKAHPEISRLTALAIAREYQSALSSARRLALHTSAAGKLASTLLDWAIMDHPASIHTHLPISFPMLLSQEDLGSMAGLSRETVSRLLTLFRREGLIEQTADQITLNNPVRLESRYR